MEKIILFSGMDFAGKTSVTTAATKMLAPDAVRQEKLLSTRYTPEDVRRLKELKKRALAEGTWNREREAEFADLLITAAIDDIENVGSDKKYIIQDSLILMKYYTKAAMRGQRPELLRKYENVIAALPEMDSVYLTVNPEERFRRFDIREASGERLTNSDQTLKTDPKAFFELDALYTKVIRDRFPKTHIVDTSNTGVKDAARIALDKVFTPADDKTQQ